MKLFLYVIKDYFKYVLGIIVLCVFLFVLFDFIHKTTKYFSQYDPTPIDLALYYYYQMPSQLIQGLPIAALLASVVTMVLLSRTNEITAMRAAGMSPLRVGAPLAVGGMAISLFSLCLSELVQPTYAEKMYYVKEVVIEGESESALAEGAHWVRDEKVMFNFKDYDPMSGVMQWIQLIELSESFLPVKAMYAKRAEYMPSQDEWLLTGVSVLELSDTGRLLRQVPIEELTLKLPVSPAKLTKERRKPSELSTMELVHLIERRQDAGLDNHEYIVDYHFKLAYPFAAFVVSLIGLQFGYRSERTTETVKGVLVAFGVGIGYWFVMTASKALCARGALPPVVGAWIANLSIFSISILQNLKHRA